MFAADNIRPAHLGAYVVDVVVDVDAISHNLLVAVFHDQVFVEEAKVLLAWRGVRPMR